MSLFIESIRWEFSKYHLLDYHADRMERTVRAIFKSKRKFDLEKILPRPSSDKALLKCRIIYNDKLLKIEWNNYRRHLCSDHYLLTDDTVEYTYKSEVRDHLDKLKKQVDLANDIIIVKNKMITDAYYSNLIFFNGQDWITPAEPLLNGVMRSHLLDSQIIHKGDIKIKDLNQFQVFKKINAMNPFKAAPIYLVKNIKILH